jgi:hypothetical protein
LLGQLADESRAAADQKTASEIYGHLIRNLGFPTYRPTKRLVLHVLANCVNKT